MKVWFLSLMLTLSMLMSCTKTPPASPIPEVETLNGQANVEMIEVIMLTSFPLQVHVQVKGFLADPCSGIDEIQVSRDGNQFEVMITTESDPELDCIQVIEPFEQNIPLHVYGLPAGDYLVVVNGVEAEFTFFQDNVLGE